MQQLFLTLQEERNLHQEKLDEMNNRMSKLQQESDKSRAASISLTCQLLQKSPGGNQSNAKTKTTLTADIPNTITTT